MQKTLAQTFGDFHYWFHHEELYIDQAVDQEAWIRHRSWKRHLPEGFAFVRVLHSLGYPVGFYIVVSFLVCSYAQWAEDAGAPKIFSHQNEARSHRYFTALLLTSFAVGLLIVFRTNSSYARWWEARTIWGGMLGITKNIMRQSAAWFPASEKDKLLAVARWTSALTPALKLHCRWEKEIRTELQDRLLPHELDFLASVDHPPIMVAAVLTQLVASANLSDMLQISFIHFQSLVGTSKHQKARYTSKCLLWWLAGIPFAFWADYGWASPFITTVIAFCLLGVENVGIQMEEPFEVLPIQAISGACVAGVHEIMERHAESRQMMSLLRADTRQRFTALYRQTGCTASVVDNSV